MLNIPETTAASGKGDIFFQLSAPSSYQWVAIGQGTTMAGANIFVMYTAGDGNVTISPRLGTGFVMPKFNSDAKVTLLEGSGVMNGKMVANVRCESCNTWSGGSASFSGNAGDWIYAYKMSGGAKDTTSQSASISKHDDGNEPFQWSYADAKGGTSVNPLVNAAPMATGNGSGTGTMTGTASKKAAARKAKMIIAHAVLASLAFVIFFPLGSILIRLASFRGAIWVHAAFQVFAYLVFVPAFAIGIRLTKNFYVNTLTFLYSLQR
jgi:hypothetical protein